MYRIILIFLLYIATYHISTTLLMFGIGETQNSTLIPLIRDSIRALGTITITLLHRSKTKQILSQTYKRRGAILITLLFALILSRGVGQSLYDMLIGIKYGFLYLLILLASIHLGSGRKQQHYRKFFHHIGRLYIVIVCIGRIRQILKFIWPDFFFAIGYGPIGDFVFGENPPVYYRTGPGGDPRRQGIFAGPNNYGYFLVATLPFMLYRVKTYTKQKIQKRGKAIVTILRTITILATLSRAAILGLMICLAILYKNQRQKNKKRTIAITIIGIAILGAISLYKGGSTIEHLTQKIQGFQEVIHTPLGYGLGTAGPAVHHNGSILPENYYIQLMIDIGTIGFLLRTSIIASRFILIKKYRYNKGYERQRAFFIGILALFIMGFFLHVFEDSMINYLVFIPYAISITYLIEQKQEKKTQHKQMSIQ